MLSLTSTGLLIPTACQILSQTTQDKIVKQSRGVAVVLIIIYCLYLRCTLFTHYSIFAEESQKKQKTPMHIKKGAPQDGAIKRGLVRPISFFFPAIPGDHEGGDSNNEKLWRLVQATPQPDEDDEAGEDPQLHILVAIATFLASAVLLFLCTDYFIDRLDELIKDSGLSSTFVGLVFSPIPNCDSAPVTV